MVETHTLSDGFLPTWKICPYCGSDDTRAMFSLANAGRLLGLGVVSLVVLLIAVLTDYVPGESVGGSADKDSNAGMLFDLKRACRRCGGRFRPRPVHEPTILCGRCDYNLTGNISGVCPECGWTIPPDVRKRIQPNGMAQPE